MKIGITGAGISGLTAAWLLDPEHQLVVFEKRNYLGGHAHYRAQERMAAAQGRDNVWFAGSYLYDVDSLESGVRSAIEVVRRLSPHSAHLTRLLSGSLV